MENSQRKPMIKNQLFLINRDFQLKYTKAAVGVGILSTVLTAVIILYPLFAFEILRIPHFLPWPIFTTMAVATLVNISFLALMGVFVTHRIAGPMYSLVKHIRLVGLGQWGIQMKLRDDDELKFVVRNFNEMILELKQMGTNDYEDIKAVKAAIVGKETEENILALISKMELKIEKRINIE